MNMALVKNIKTAIGKHNLIAQPSPEFNPFKKVVQGKYFRLDLFGENQLFRF